MTGRPTSAQPPRTGSRRCSVRFAVLAPLVAAAVACAGVGVGAGSEAAPPPGGPSTAAAQPGHADTRAALAAMVAAGTPGVIARVDGNHRHWTGTAGVADLDRPRPRNPAEHFRIASITKTFTAVTLLKLEAEGRLSLDDSVERWLPGVLDGNGYDGHSVTVRQLLNHTSGIYDVLDDRGFASRYMGTAFLEHRFDDCTPRRLVDIAVSHPPVFEPGTRWGYSNTNYLLAGMIIEAVTGHPYAEVVESRLLRPLGLHGTSLPGHSPAMPEPHARAYSTLFVDSPDATVYDVTEFDPSLAGAAGEIISTATDLNRFLSRLLNGSVLPPRQQRELLTGIDTGQGDRYGLGLRTYELSCGTFWGNDGDIFGSVTYTVSSADGSHVLTMNTNDNRSDDALARRVLEIELC